MGYLSAPADMPTKSNTGFGINNENNRHAPMAHPLPDTDIGFSAADHRPASIPNGIAGKLSNYLT
ncbi:MAG: hypothetical protein CL749_00210 [Chloroflexi bacterium]|nr:hypothetical protein [Chloroflexota bacterium]MQG02194.1 hypothetical protein [SAR202 cluster bacterium]